MLKFHDIEIENFLSFKDKQYFKFNTNGLYSIDGINLDNMVSGSDNDISKYSIGSGKSSFTMAIGYALWGIAQKEAIRNIKKDRIINKEAKKNLRVALKFSVNGNTYLIERYRKHKEFKNQIFIKELINNKWQDISKSDIDMTQELINSIIVLNPTTFNKSILLTREDSQQFLDFGPPDRARVFENIIQLSKLKDWGEKIKKKIKEVEDEYSYTISTLNGFKIANKNYQEHIEEELSEIHSKEKKILKELKILEKKMIDITASKITPEKIISISEKIYNTILLSNKYENNIKNLTQQLSHIDNNAKDNKNSIKRISELLDDLNKKYKKIKPIKCFNCNAIQNKEEYEEEKNNITKNINKYTKTLNELKEENNKKENIKNNIKTELDNEINKWNIIKNELNELVLPADLKTIVIENANQNKPNTIANEIREINHRITLKKQELENLNKNNIIKFKNKIKQNEKELIIYRKKKEKIETRLKILDFWKQTLDMGNENSMKQHIIGRVIPIFNNLLQQNLDYVYNGNMSIMFDSNFRETMIYNNEDYNYDELSTGEKIKVNLAINFSIFDMTRINLSGSNVIFLDEVFTNVDYDTIDSFIKLIRKKYAKDSAVYVISHQETVKELLKPLQTIEIIKENNTSKIVIKE